MVPSALYLADDEYDSEEIVVAMPTKKDTGLTAKRTSSHSLCQERQYPNIEHSTAAHEQSPSASISLYPGSATQDLSGTAMVEDRVRDTIEDSEGADDELSDLSALSDVPAPPSPLPPPPPPLPPNPPQQAVIVGSVYPETQVLHAPPAIRSITNHAFGEVIEDSESELSDLGSTPPRPLFDDRGMRLSNHKEFCFCKSWCTCPKGAAYPNPSPAHLPSSALYKPEAAVVGSAERSTLELGHQRRCNSEYVELTVSQATMCFEVAEGLRRLSTDMLDADAASRFVDRIVICYPPSSCSQYTKSVIQVMHEALRAWRENGDYVSLQLTVEYCIFLHPDLIVDFQAFMPKVYRNIDLDYEWELLRTGLPWELDAQPKSYPCGWFSKVPCLIPARTARD